MRRIWVIIAHAKTQIVYLYSIKDVVIVLFLTPHVSVSVSLRTPSEDNTDPFRSLTIGVEDTPEVQSEYHESEDDSPVFSSDE